MAEPMRVLQVLGRLNRGGAESMIMNLFRNVDREKVQFDFVIHTDKHCDFTDEVLSLGGRIYSAPRYNVKNHLVYKKWWNNFFREHPEYKVIHGHMYSIASIYLKIAKKYGLVTISHSHTSSQKAGFNGVVKRIIQAPLKNIPDWLFACSDNAGRWLYGENIGKRKNYILLKNAIETENYVYSTDVSKKIRNEFNIEDKFVMGHIGRMFPAKNHPYILEVFKVFHQKNLNSVLLLVGDGPSRKEIEERAEALGIKDKVIFTGVRGDVNEILQAMDCFVFPSFYEGLPVTVIEAQAASLPCFISDTITEEVCVTDLVTRHSIKDNPKIWVDKIQERTSSFKRVDKTKEIIDSGYDIKATSKWLQNFYIEKAGN